MSLNSDRVLVHHLKVAGDSKMKTLMNLDNLTRTDPLAKFLSGTPASASR